MHKISSAAMKHCHDGMYVGEDGARCFAREVGAALPDFSKDDKDIRDMMSSTYGAICVIAYNLKPPIDSKTWLESMREGVQAALSIVPVPKPENYTPTQVVHLDEITIKKAIWRGEGWNG